LDKVTYTLDEANRKESLGLWGDKVEMRKRLCVDTHEQLSTLRRYLDVWIPFHSLI
jgi:hypothetical protein